MLRCEGHLCLVWLAGCAADCAGARLAVRWELPRWRLSLLESHSPPPGLFSTEQHVSQGRPRARHRQPPGKTEDRASGTFYNFRSQFLVFGNKSNKLTQAQKDNSWILNIRTVVSNQKSTFNTPIIFHPKFEKDSRSLPIRKNSLSLRLDFQ